MLCLSQTENNYWKSTALPVTEFRINLVLGVQMRLLLCSERLCICLVLAIARYSFILIARPDFGGSPTICTIAQSCFHCNCCPVNWGHWIKNYRGTVIGLDHAIYYLPHFFCGV